jgi:MFS transporter, SHS family, lactate transporter
MAPYFVKNLIPRREARQSARPLITVLRSLTWLQWAHYFSGWLAWTCDATDFFSVSLSVNALSEQFGKNTAAITQAITLTLLLRSAGALIFGIISDRYGRKWPLVANLLIIAILQLCVGFVTTYQQFLAVRSLFGIGMGGIWGMAASTALENLPVEVRGLASGFLQQGYAVGYLIAAVIELFLVPKTVKASWRTLFWTGAGISAFAAAVRAVLPESQVFLRAKRETELSGKEKVSSGRKTKQFFKETKEMLRRHWLLCIYAVLIMSGTFFVSLL